MHAHAEKPPEKVWIRWEPEEEKEREKKKVVNCCCVKKIREERVDLLVESTMQLDRSSF